MISHDLKLMTSSHNVSHDLLQPIMHIVSRVAVAKLLGVHLRHDINLSQVECGPMPNVMVALPNIGGALCSTPQSLAVQSLYNYV